MKPTPIDFVILNQARALMRDLTCQITDEGVVLEALVRQIALEESCTEEHTAFLVCLALGNVTEENWQELIIPF